MNLYEEVYMVRQVPTWPMIKHLAMEDCVLMRKNREIAFYSPESLRRFDI